VIRRAWTIGYAAAVVEVALAASALALFPDADALADPLSLALVGVLYACVGAVVLLPWSLPIAAGSVSVLFFVRRPWARRLAVAYVAVHWLLGSLVLVETSALFVFRWFRFAAGIAAAVFLALRLRPNLDRHRPLTIAANLLPVLAVATFFANAAAFESPADLARRGIATYFPSTNNYDAVAFPGDGRTDRLAVAVGYGGGVFVVDGTDFPKSIRAAAKDLFRPERLIAHGAGLLVSNNAAGDARRPDAVLLAGADLADRKEIAFPEENRIIDIALDAAKDRLLLLDEETPRLAVWDLAAWRPVTEIRLAAGRRFNANAVTVDAAARRAYVCSWLQGRSLYVVDLDALALARTAPVGVSVADVAVDEARGVLYLARPLLSRIDVLDRRTFAWKASLPTVAGARKLLFLPERDLLIVASYFTGEIEAIDLQVVASYFTGRLEAIDLYDPAWQRRIRAFPRVRGLRYDATTDRVLVASLRGVFAVPVSAFVRPPAR
jgi:hypothetical protein